MNAKLKGSSTPTEVIHLFLSPPSPRRAANTAILNTHNHPHQYKKIGFGQCGLIFDYPAHGAVLKLARPHFTEALWNDCLVHRRVYQAFQQASIQCRVPVPYSYISKTNKEWRTANLHSLSSEPTAGFPLPTPVLISQRIPPLCNRVRSALIELYCAPGLTQAAHSSVANQDCLIRVYLGRRRVPHAPLPPNFSLRNYNLHLDQLIQLDLPIELFATQMAKALAAMHWSAFIDGYDVEFVLGGEAVFDDTQHNQVRRYTSEALEALTAEADLDGALRSGAHEEGTNMWLLDFNLCSRWQEETVLEYPEQVISQLVLSFFENDPYYPLPLMEPEPDRRIWSIFQATYLQKSDEILQQSTKYAEMSSLPAKFIDGCVARERQKIADGLGHGHRDLKG